MSNVIAFATDEAILSFARDDFTEDFYERIHLAAKMPGPERLTNADHQRLGTDSTLYNLYWFVDCNSALSGPEGQVHIVMGTGRSAMTIRDLTNTLRSVNRHYKGNGLREVVVEYRDEGDHFQKTHRMVFHFGTTLVTQKTAS